MSNKYMSYEYVIISIYTTNYNVWDIVHKSYYHVHENKVDSVKFCLLRNKTYVPVFYRGIKIWVRVQVRMN